MGKMHIFTRILLFFSDLNEKREKKKEEIKQIECAHIVKMHEKMYSYSKLLQLLSAQFAAEFILSGMVVHRCHQTITLFIRSWCLQCTQHAYNSNCSNKQNKIYKLKMSRFLWAGRFLKKTYFKFLGWS